MKRPIAAILLVLSSTLVRADAFEQTMQLAIVNSKPPAAAGCAPAFVVATQAFSTSGAVNTTGATLLVAEVNGTAVTAPTDSKSNTWTPLTTYTGTELIKMFYVANPTVGTGHTFTNNAGGGTVLLVAAFSGVTATSPFDTGTDVGNHTTSTTTIQAGSITPGQTCNLLVAGITTASGSNTFSVDSGFTIIQTQNSFSPSNSLAYFVDSASAPINPTWTINAPSDLAANIAGFKHL